MKFQSKSQEATCPVILNNSVNMEPIYKYIKVLKIHKCPKLQAIKISFY